MQALHDYEDGLADFADCLMAARYQQLGCSAMLTFDAKASRLPVCSRLSLRQADFNPDC